MAGQLVAIQAFDANGVPVAGAKFKTEAAGTTTPKAAYADEAGTVALSNPVTTNAAGIAACWLKSGIGDYKISLTDPTGSVFLFRTIDNYTPATDSILYIIGSDIETARTEALDAATAAELAQSLAETAQANAETAEQNAENAQTGAESAQAAAAASAATATTQAGIATTQAGIATTQAGLAATARTGAETAETNAETAQAAAEAAQAFTQDYADADIDEPVEGQGIVTFNPATAINLATNVITIAGNTLLQDEPVTYRNGGGTAPPGLTHDAQYWVVNKSGNDFALSATRGGAPVDITGAGAGTTHQLLPVRSAKDRAHYARQSELAARADAVDAAATLAAIEEIHLGSFANAAAAWAATGAATGALYFDTTIGALYVLGAAAPAAERFAPPLASQAQAEAGTENSAYMSALRTAQAIAALSPAPVIASTAESQAGTNNTKFITPLRLAEGAPFVIFGSKFRTHKYFGISDTGAENMTPWINAWSALNDGSVTAIQFGPGDFTLADDSYLPVIDGGGASSVDDFISITGFGPATKLRVAAGAGTVGRIFDLGGSGDFLRTFNIDGFDIQFLNTPSVTDYVFRLTLAREGFISRITGRTWGNAIETTQAGIINLRDWLIDVGAQAGLSDANFKFRNLAVLRMTDIEYSGVAAGNGDPDGAFIDIASGLSGANIDTIMLRGVEMQLSSVTGASANGRPVGIRLRKPAGDTGALTNLIIRDSIFDHNTVKVIDCQIDSGNTDANSRVWEITGNRCTTDKGFGFDFDNDSTDRIGNAYAGLRIADNTIIMQTNDPAIRVSGILWNCVDIDGNFIRDRMTPADGAAFTARIDAAIHLDCSNVNIHGNTVESDDGIGFTNKFSAVTDVDTATDTITLTAHGYTDGMELLYRINGGTAPAGLVDDTVYVVRDAAANTFKLTTHPGGPAIDITAVGTGSSHQLVLKTRFKSFVKTITSTPDNINVSDDNRIACPTYWEEGVLPTLRYANRLIRDPKKVSEQTNGEWSWHCDYFDRLATGTSTPPDTTYWNKFKGSDGTTIDPYIDATAERGLLTFDIKNTATKTMAVNGVQVIGPLLYQTQRGLVIEGSPTVNDINDAVTFFGLTDQNTALEIPALWSGGVVTANADELCGFLLDTQATPNVANWRAVARKAAGTVKSFDIGNAQSNSIYKNFRIEIDYLGNAFFYLQDVYLGRMTLAVSANVSLAPTFACFSKNGGFFARLDRFEIGIRRDRPAS